MNPPPSPTPPSRIIKSTGIIGWGCLLPVIWFLLVALFGRAVFNDLGLAGIRSGSHFDVAGFARGFGLLIIVGSILTLILAVALNRRTECSRCRGRIHKQARVCPHCHADLIAPPSSGMLGATLGGLIFCAILIALMWFQSHPR